VLGLEKLGFLGSGANDVQAPPSFASKDEIERRRKLAAELLKGGMDYSPVQHWAQGLARIGQAANGAIEDYQATKADREANAEANRVASTMPGFGAAAGILGIGDRVAPAPVTSGQRDANTPLGGDASAPFLDTLRAGGVTNPNALAAVGATGYHESRWSPDKLNASWSDPSQSGQPGTAGGALSWRAERLDKLRQFAAANGEQGNGSAATQAKFFMQEDPALIERLNASKSPDEAMQHMNNAWRYAGYDKPDGETAARMNSVRQWSARMAPVGGDSSRATPDAAAGQSSPVQVAQAGGGISPATGGPSMQQLMGVINSPVFERLPAGTQMAAKAMLQRLASQETKDPLTIAKTQAELDKLKLDTEKTRRELGRKDMETVTAPDGQVWQREKGSDGEYKPVLKLGQKDEANTTRQKELEQINKEREGAGLPKLRLDQLMTLEKEAGAQRTTINNAVNPVLKGLGDQFVEGAAGARAQADTIRSIHTARQQLDDGGGIISGAGANQVLALQKVGAALGITDASKITNTETFRTSIKPIVLETVKGLGAGSGVSNADREFALQAVGGDITLDEKSIRRVLDITERAARSKIDRHNKLSEEMVKAQPDIGAVAPMLRIEMPGEYTKPSIQPADVGQLPPTQPKPGTPQRLRYNPQTGALE